MLEILSTNRDLKATVEEEEKMLSMRWDELPSYDIGFEKGIEQGIEQEKTKIILNMLDIFDDDKIHQITGASLDEIKRIRKNKI